MIGIITFISVLERKKEIGILRSIGASRRDIANVFNDETFDKRLSIEALSTFGWGKYVGLDGISIGLDTFGASSTVNPNFSSYNH